ncbi:ABC transporter permease [Mycoplasmopsis cynos]|nr:ABC transporter permease [Mycoplasmopsis felis]WQQ11747.1 ABC transporter permease [Mycoplasmopsis felis]
MNSLRHYVFFIHKLILKKKNTIIIPMIILLSSFIFFGVFSFIEINNNQKLLFIYILVFIELLMTIFFAALKSINVYKDLEEEGIELLTLSKPISRKSIIWGKTISNLLFAFYWTLIILISNTIIIWSLNILNTHWNLILITIGVFYLSYILFGYLSSLIAYKTNTKIAITLPILLFSPLAIGGTVISGKSTSTANNFAYYLNIPYENHSTGKRLNAEQFYLNNQNDSYYIIPNGYQNDNFRNDQKKFLNLAYSNSKNSAKEWQIYSYLVTPYQMVDIFNVNNTNIFDTFSSNNTTNLSNYLFYNQLDSFSYNYDLLSKSNLKQYDVIDKSQSTESTNATETQPAIDAVIVNKKAYLVPGALKNKSIKENLINTNIIYARENADSFNVEFPEDNNSFTTTDNLVGEIKWAFLLDLLENLTFQDYALKFFDDINKNIKDFSQEETKIYFIENLTNAINSDSSHLLQINDVSSIVLNPASIKNKNIKNLTEKKVYLAIGLLYFAYFTYNDSKLLDAILFNENTQNYEPEQFLLKIDNYNYKLGGYASFTPKQIIQEEEINGSKQAKIVIRYDLSKSDNYLFQPLEEIYEISRSNIKVVEKNIYFGIWVILGILLLVWNNKLYYRKDYK